MLEGEKPGWERLFWKKIDYKAPPTEVVQRKVAAYKEIRMFATIKADNVLSWIREILRPRQKAVNISRNLCCRGAELNLHISPPHDRS